jgi:hypothetical protein
MHLNLFTVKESGEGDNKKSFFTKIGAMFPHKTGEGWSLQFDAFPADGTGKVVAFPPKDDAPEDNKPQKGNRR